MSLLKQTLIKYISLLFEPVIGYTRMVSATKLILSILALILIAYLIILPLVNPVHDNFRLTFSHIEKGDDIEKSVMMNPRFQGVDSSDQTYNITAKTAVREGEETLILNSINSDINLKDDSWVSVMAGKGYFQYGKRKVNFTEGVSIFNSDGDEFHSDEMSVNIKTNSAYGYRPVRGQSDMGTLTADGFFIENKGERVVFRGNVKIVIYPAALKSKK